MRLWHVPQSRWAGGQARAGHTHPCAISPLHRHHPPQGGLRASWPPLPCLPFRPVGKSPHPAQVERFQTVYNLEVGFLHTCAQSITIHSSQKVEATQVSTNGPTDKQTAMYPCNGILFSPQNAVNPDTGYSVEGSEDNTWGKKDKVCGTPPARGPWSGQIRGDRKQARAAGGQGVSSQGVGSCCSVGTRVLVSHDEKILGVAAQEHEWTQHC